MSNNIHVDIVVVNWNSGRQILTCIDSIKFISTFHTIHSFIVDNGSTDGSIELVKNLSRLTVVRSNTNLGFGKACNLGAQLGSSEYLLFLNPDAALFPDTLAKSISFMQDPVNNRVGICGVQLLDESGSVARSCARFPRALGYVAHALGVVHFLPRLGHFMAEWTHDQTQEVDHVIGAFYLIRRKLFEDLGGFDERFFVYLEDLDLSYRARQAGWRSVYLAQAQAFHAGGGTSNQIMARRLFYSLRSRLLYAFKHFSVLGAMLVLLTTLFVEPFTRTAFGLLRRSWPTVKETWSGYGMLWRWLPQWIFNGVTR
jgi:GT2 family glycosyltransferase